MYAARPSCGGISNCCVRREVALITQKRHNRGSTWRFSQNCVDPSCIHLRRSSPLVRALRGDYSEPTADGYPDLIRNAEDHTIGTLSVHVA
jgi:hypothetical protein